VDYADAAMSRMRSPATACLPACGRLWAVAAVVLLSTTSASAQPAQDVEAPRGFIENRGQWPGEIVYGGRVGPLTVSASQHDLNVLMGSPGARTTLRIGLEGDAGSAASWAGSDRLPGLRHFIIGDDPAKWRKGVPAFGSLSGRAGDASLRLTQQATALQLTFALENGGGLPIEIETSGARAVTLESDGSVVIATGSGNLRLSPPAISVQGSSDPRHRDARFDVSGAGTIRVIPPSRAGAAPLLLTSALEWGTFVGGTDAEFVSAVITDEAGAVTVAGHTESPDLPTTAGAFDSTPGVLGTQIGDIFVCTLDSEGTLQYGTYLGGVAAERVAAVRRGTDGSLTIIGRSFSTDYPTTPGAFMEDKLGPFGAGDAVVTRLSADGSELVFSTYVGGLGTEIVTGGVLLPDASVVFCGATQNPSYPDTIGDPIPGVGNNAFVTRLLPDGSGLVFSEVFGGESLDDGEALAWHPSGRIVVSGDTSSSNFPFTPGAFRTNPTPFGMFVAQFDDQTGQMLFATALGGSNGDSPSATAVDVYGNVYLAGLTQSLDFPTTPDAFQPAIAPSLGAPDGFIACLDPTLSTLLHSTYLGGNLQDWVTDIDVDPSGLVTVSGITNSEAYPVTAGAFDTQLIFQGSYDAFVSRFSRDLSTLHYSTYLGGDSTENLTSGKGAVLDVAPDGRVAVAVGTISPDFPVTPGTLSTSLQGASDVAVAVLHLLPTGVATLGTSTPGCSGPLVFGVTAMPQVASEVFALNCTGAPATSPRGLLLISLGALATPVKAGGVDLYLDPASLLVLLPLTSDAYGYTELPLRVPTDPATAGLHAAAQVVWRDPCAQPGPFSASQALEITIQP
jgi:hypothetical protein